MDKPILLSANLGSKNAIAVITLFSADRYLVIEFQSNVEWKARSHFVRLYVANEEVAKSTNSKPQLSALKLGWNADNQM
jgi:alpha-mannosidase